MEHERASRRAAQGHHRGGDSGPCRAGAERRPRGDLPDHRSAEPRSRREPLSHHRRERPHPHRQYQPGAGRPVRAVRDGDDHGALRAEPRRGAAASRDGAGAQASRRLLDAGRARHRRARGVSPDHRPGADLGRGADDRPGAGELVLRQPARAEADRFGRGHQPPHHGGRPVAAGWK